MKGFFGNLFDMNKDGELNATERFMDFMQNSAVLAVTLSAGRLIGDLFIALFLYCAHDSGHDVGLGRLFQIDRGI